MTCSYSDPLAVLDYLLALASVEEGCEKIDELYEQACSVSSLDCAQARLTLCLLLGVMPSSIKFNFFANQANAAEILAYLKAHPLHWSYADHFTNTSLRPV